MMELFATATVLVLAWQVCELRRHRTSGRYTGAWGGERLSAEERRAFLRGLAR